MVLVVLMSDMIFVFFAQGAAIDSECCPSKNFKSTLMMHDII